MGRKGIGREEGKGRGKGKGKMGTAYTAYRGIDVPGRLSLLSASQQIYFLTLRSCHRSIYSSHMLLVVCKKAIIQRRHTASYLRRRLRSSVGLVASSAASVMAGRWHTRLETV